jgi:hypothetical protein
MPVPVIRVMLGGHAGINQRDIGGLLSMGTGSAVCRQLKRLRARRRVVRIWMLP